MPENLVKKNDTIPVDRRFNWHGVREFAGRRTHGEKEISESSAIQMTKKTKIILVVVFVLVAAVFYAFSRPILFGFYTGPMPGDDEFVVLNPFRDRAQERPAEEFLEQLKTGQCTKVIGVIPGDETYHKHICEREKDLPIVSWRLRRIDTEGGSVALSYRYRHEGEPSDDILYIWVEKMDGSWKVIKYVRGY